VIPQNPKRLAVYAPLRCLIYVTDMELDESGQGCHLDSMWIVRNETQLIRYSLNVFALTLEINVLARKRQ